TSGQIIGDVNVRLNVTHTFDGDLDIFLGFDDGSGVTRCVELSTDTGSSGDNFVGTLFDDEAPIAITSGVAPFTGPHRPESPLSVLDGLPANGTFTLFISDDAGGDTGTLDSWSLELTAQDPTVVQTCTVGANGCLSWVPGVDCGTGGQQCADGSGTAQCVSCQGTCPAAGVTQCYGETIETCTVNAQGCVEWVAGTDCSANGEFCDGSGAPAVCVPCF